VEEANPSRASFVSTPLFRWRGAGQVFLSDAPTLRNFTELDETEREDMEGYAPYDADAGDRRSETWGVRNVHHEWSFCRVGGAALEGDESIDHETPFSGPVRPPAVRVYSRLIGES
jgi:hypothetical protein